MFFSFYYSKHFLALNTSSVQASKQFIEGKTTHCKVCSKVCQDMDALMNHTKKCRIELQVEVDKVEKRMQTCNKCGQYFKQKIKYNKHKCPNVQSEPELKIKETFQCEFPPDLPPELEQQTFLCEMCPEKFNDTRTFQLHLASSHFSDYFRKYFHVTSKVHGMCPRKGCKTVIKNFDEYIEHVAITHEKLFKVLVNHNKDNLAKSLFPHKSEGSMTSTETGSRSQKSATSLPSHRDSVEDRNLEDTPLKKDNFKGPEITSKPSYRSKYGAKGLKCPICQQHVKDALNIHLSTGHYQ